MCFGFAVVAFGYDLDDELVLGEYLVEDSELSAELENESIEALSTLNGWVSRGNYWYYYANGRPLTGWHWHIASWYFLHPATGRMQTGWWTELGGRRYFLNPRSGQGHDPNRPEGAMLFGWLYYRNNWFYLNAISGRDGFPQGVMRTGWASVQGDFYFFNPPATSVTHRRELLPGAMRTGTVVIDGIRDAEGRLISRGQVFRFRPCGRSDRSMNSTMIHHSLWWQRNDFGETEIPFTSAGVGPAWLPFVVRAMNYWNSTSVPVRFTSGTRYNNTARVTVTHEDWLGSVTIAAHRRLSPLTEESVLQRFEIRLYAENINNHVAARPGFTINNVVTSVMAHELGHVLGIFDNPLQHDGPDGSIMSQSRNRNRIFAPTSNDVMFANFLNNR